MKKNHSLVDVTGSGGKAQPSALRFVIGNEANKNLDLEAMYTTTTSKDSRLGYGPDSVSAKGYTLSLGTRF